MIKVLWNGKMMNKSENRKKSVLPATDLCLQTCCMDYIYGKKKAIH